MDDADLIENIDRVLHSLHKHLRSPDQTLANLGRLIDPLDPSHRERATDHLFRLLVKEIRSKSPADHNALQRQRESFSILFKALFEFGSVDLVLCKIFAYLDVNNPDIVNNWTNCVCQELAGAIYLYGDKLTEGALKTVKEYVAMFSHPGTDFARAMPAFSACVVNINHAIENVEFTRFELGLRQVSEEVPTADVRSERTADKLLPSAIDTAMKEAHEYLRGDGPFNPKKAADLMRSSIDELHREIVAKIVALTGVPCADINKDGVRRAYLRKAGFISEPEETFFSAIYTLLSQEASHKLIAPRETMLVMVQTVQGYLALLNRRLSSFTVPTTSP